MGDGLRVEVLITLEGVEVGRIPLGNCSAPLILADMNLQLVPSREPVVGPSGITRALSAWADDMARRGCRPQSVKVFQRAVRQAAVEARWDDPGDMSYAGAVGWLARARADRGWSGTTADGAVSALRNFSRFCHAAGLIPADPFMALCRSGEVGGEGDRALTLEEVRRLVAVAAIASARDRRAKVPRGLYYATLALTGLRGGEAAEIRWGAVELDADPPRWSSDPAWAKNGKRQRVVMPTQLRDALRVWARCTPSGREDRVFPQVPNRHTFARDRIAAGIPELDGRGRRVGIHSLRKAWATMLYDTGASEAVIARLMRHADSITLSRYVDPDTTMEREAAERIPRILDDGQASESSVLALWKTGRSERNSTEPLEISSPIPDDAPAKTSTPANRTTAPVLRKSSQTEPSQAPGAVLPVAGVGRPGPLASAARRERSSDPSRDGHTPHLRGLNGQSRAASEGVLNLLASAAADLAAAVRSLGQAAEVEHGDGESEG